MIDHTFLHCSGIGPKTEKRLKSLGFLSWNDCLQKPDDLPFKSQKREKFIQQLQNSQTALQSNDIPYLVSHLPIREHWRILGEYFTQATFFDIETTGLSSYDSFTTVIVAYYKNKLYTFSYGENIDDFLNLVDNSELLVAFNGNSFDIPFLEQSFNIPDIGCPYIDLRWICYYCGYTGGLKLIERQLGIKRPEEIGDVEGYEAVQLFYDWQDGNKKSRSKLIKYCQADVLSTYLVAGYLVDKLGFSITIQNQEYLFKKLNQFTALY